MTEAKRGDMDLNDGGSSGIKSCPRIIFVVDGPLVANFFSLLQQGVKIRSRIGCSFASFLSEEIGAGAGTIEKIQSVILDGKPVDELESSTIRDGSVIALSAAMPGLVGATLRRGGGFSSLRSTITYHEAGGECIQGEGLVQIKIFNLLMSELGPNLLRKGVIIRSEDFIRFAAEQSEDFWRGCRLVTFDGEPLNALALADDARLSGKKEVFLSVVPDQAGA